MREPGVDHVGRAAGKGEPRDVDIDARAVRRGDDRIVTPAVERGVPGDVGCEGVADFVERRSGGKAGHHASPACLLRSEERRVGKECVRKFISWWAQFY